MGGAVEEGPCGKGSGVGPCREGPAPASWADPACLAALASAQTACAHILSHGLNHLRSFTAFVLFEMGGAAALPQ